MKPLSVALVQGGLPYGCPYRNGESGTSGAIQRCLLADQRSNRLRRLTKAQSKSTRSEHVILELDHDGGIHRLCNP
jgi:hypothetical protein